MVDDLFVILHPTVYERSAEELRATKELEVVKAIRALLKRQQAASKRKDAKPDAKPPPSKASSALEMPLRISATSQSGAPS